MNNQINKEITNVIKKVNIIFKLKNISLFKYRIDENIGNDNIIEINIGFNYKRIFIYNVKNDINYNINIYIDNYINIINKKLINYLDNNYLLNINCDIFNNVQKFYYKNYNKKLLYEFLLKCNY